MENLAQQLKNELTQRAKDSESCKKYLLDYVMQCFREGENPVELYCKNSENLSLDSELGERLGEKKKKTDWIDFKYEDGKHFAKLACYAGKDWHDITDLKWAQMFAVDGKDESDKRLFLESEGFHVYKTWIYGRGTVLQITY